MNHQTTESEKPTEQAQCPYCKQPDSDWKIGDLLRGKRAMPDGTPGVQYHCINAFYGAQ